MIKVKPGYSLRKVLDAFLIMGSGKAAYRPNCIMSLNETGAFLWNCMLEGEDEGGLIARMTAEYDVDRDRAAKDVAAFLTQLREKSLIEE